MRMKSFVAVLLTLTMVFSVPGGVLAAVPQDAEPAAETTVEKEAQAEKASDAQTDNTDKDEQKAEEDQKSEDSQAKESLEKKETKDNETKDEETKDEEETVSLEKKTLDVNRDNYEITVSGMMPEDAELDVKEVSSSSDEYKDYIKDASKEVFKDSEEKKGDTLPYARFFDIKIKYADGEEFQPDNDLTLKIDTKDGTLKDEDLDFSAVHFVENKDDADEYDTQLVKMDIEKDKVASMKADSFSVYGVVYSYTVDFYYENAEHHMNGGSEMKLSELFGKLGIEKDTKDISKVEFTDDSLVKFTKEGDDYNIASLKPFTTGETLTITFNDGTVITIAVEDEIASGVFGVNNNIKWSIDDEGHFVLEPVSGESGIIPNTYASPTEKNGTTPRAGTRLWPWEQYKDKIVTAEIKSEIRTYGLGLPGMFEYCDNLVSVDVSGLNVSRVDSVTFFFANCPKLKTINGLDKWAESKNGNTLVGTGAIKNVASMFRNSSALEEIDLSAWTSNGVMKNFQNMCTGCTSLKSFKLNNPNFKTDPASQWHTGSNGPFKDCDALETVDMSNITVGTNANGLKEMFTGLSSLKEVTMKDIDFTGVKSLERMFNKCEKLETLTFAPKEGAAFDNDITASMNNLFSNCSKLKTLDITNLDNSNLQYNHELGFEDLDSLETLKANNSKVWIFKNPKSGKDYSSIKMENVVIKDDIDFIEDVDFEYTPLPGDPDYGGAVPMEIDSTDIIQIVVKDGTSKTDLDFVNPNAKGLLSPGTYKRTSPVDTADMKVPLTYYVIDGMDENAPTIEFLVGGEWKKWDNTKVNDSGYKEDTIGDYYVFTYPTAGGYDTRIYTKAKTNEEWEAGTNSETDSYAYEGGPIRIIYPKSATSINGTKHDVVITINNIKFEDMSRIPNTTDTTYTNFDENFNTEVISNPWGPGTYRPDNNKIPGNTSSVQSYDNTNTRRYLLNAAVGELRFWNQVTKEVPWGNENGDPFNASSRFLYSKGSGTYIDFNLNISGAQDGQSVLYWCDDLDMPENESWTMHDTDPNQDVRNSVHYAPGAEGIALGSGNDLSSITLANRTYLNLYNFADQTKKDAIETDGSIQGDNDLTTTDVANYLIGTRPDPETKKSRFYVKSNAIGSNYIWTTGTSCETTVLKSTSFERSDVLDVHINAKAGKTVNKEATPSNLDRTFDFVMEPASDIATVDVGGNNVPNKAGAAFPNPIKVKNINGNVDFGKMTFLSPGANYVDTGEIDPIYRLYKVYMDSDNRKFFYKNDGTCCSWTETIIITPGEEGEPDEEKIQYNEVTYTPYTETTKAYVFKISETEGTQQYITDWDGTEYYLKVVTTAPANDAEMQKGTKVEVTIGTKAEGASQITWGSTTTKYGSDTKDTPLEVKVGTFNNKADEVELPAGSINVEKILNGRNWKGSDKFHFIMTTTEPGTPMPEGSHVKDGIRLADLDIDSTDTKVNEYSYKDKNGFNTITFNGAHMVNEQGAAVSSKTFTYHIREEVPSESGDDRIAGITYSTERYGVKVTVKKENGELKIEKTEICPIVNGVAGEAVDIASFTNTYNANKTIYKMSAEKSFASADTSKTLKDGDYKFVLKPIGTYAAIAPMPKDSTGTEEGRTLTVENIGQGVNFEDTAVDDDGLKFLYQDEGSEKGLLTTLLPYFENDKAKVQAALHSDDGIDFEYEMYEVIPTNAVNNNNGTWSTTIDGNVYIYDGIHHTRKITVKVRPKEGSATEEELYIEGHADDHKGDFYIDKGGNEQPVSKISGYDSSEHHMTPDGAPVFRNYFLQPVTVDPPVKKVVKDTDAKDPFTYTFKPVSNTAGIDVSKMPMPAGSSGGQKQITHDGPGEYEFGEFAISIPGTYVYEITEEEGDLKYDYDTSKYTVTYVVEIKNNKLQATTTITKAGATADEAVFTNSYLGDANIDGDETYGIKGKVQTGQPKYDVNPSNPVTPKNLVKPDKEGSTISDDGKTVTIPGEGTYALNSDGSITFTPDKDFVGDPTPVSVEGSDKKGNTVTALYKPHVVDPTDKQDATRTVHFTYESKTGEQVTSDVTQTVTLTRHAAEVNAKTGEVTKWGDWEPETFPAVDNPDDKDVKEGWSTTDKVGELKVTEPGAVEDVYVIYTLDKYTVTFEDGDHGKSSGGKAEKDYGDKPQANTVTPDDGYGFTGEYDYVITDKNGEEIEKGTTKDPQSITVKGNIVFTPKYVADETETKEMTQKITYVYEDGSPVLDDEGNPIVKERKATFTRTGKYDPETGDIKWESWTEQTLPTVESPEVEGYTPDKKTIPPIAATPDNWPKDETVTYKEVPKEAPKAGSKITYGGKGDTQKGTPPFEEGSSKIVGYQLIDSESGNPVDKVTVPGQGAYTIDTKTGEVTFVPEKDFVGTATTVKVRGTDENDLYADGEYTPIVVDNTETKEMTQKISYVYEDGSPVLDDEGNPLVKERKATFTRTVKVDPETGKITWDSWTEQTLPKVDSPEISGFKPDKESVAETKATPDNWPKDEKVTYTALPGPKGPTWIEGSTVKSKDRVGRIQYGTLTFKAGDTPITHVAFIDPSTGNETDAKSVDVYDKNGKKIGTYSLNSTGKKKADGSIAYEIKFTPVAGYTGKPPAITLRAYDENMLYADGIYQPNVIGSKAEKEKKATKKQTVAKTTTTTKTGDEMPITLWLLLMSVSGAAVIAGIFRRRKEH